MSKQMVLKRLTSHLDEIRNRLSVRTLSVFGSVACGRLGRKSDVDILVAFNEKASFDLFMDLKFYLEELLGTEVDLVTEKALRPQIRQAIEKELINVA
jgi:predicted nucleotidyltransferase